MQTQEANSVIAQQLTYLANTLDAGQSASLTSFLHTMARFHNYSLGNVLLIMGQRPTATRVAGFQTWRSLGRYVKKGEKGIAILAPMLIKPQTTEGTQSSVEQTTVDTDATTESADQGKILRFRVVYIFDVSQTEGEALPEFASVDGDPGIYTERLKRLVQQHAITLEYRETLGGADGLSRKGEIILRHGLDPAAEFSVLVHEFAHELMHQGDRRDGKTQTVIETEAEAVAFVVAQAIGLDAGTSAADYIQLYRGSKELLNQSLETISSTAECILSALLA